MFEWLGKFDRIYVTGPHRSGTRICAQMIAHDTGHPYIDEVDFDYDSLYKLYARIENQQRFVVQCPALCRHVHLFSADDAAIVLMRRDVPDIIASQKRIHFRLEALELRRYDQTTGTIAEIKYKFWGEYQKSKIKNAFEIEYVTLAEHPLWIDSSLRKDFLIAQTALADEQPTLDWTRCLSPVANAVYFEQADGHVGMLVKTQRPAKSLNETGRAVWELCDGTRTLQEIAQMLAARFDDVDEPILRADLLRFADDLVKRGFLKIEP